MEHTRRKILALLCAASGAIMLPFRLLAAQWNGTAFDQTRFPDSLKAVGIVELVESDRIQLKTPEIAENGAIVPIQVECDISGTEKIFVFAEKNPQPLVASFTFLNGIDAFFATRIKMGESAKVHIVALAGGIHYTTSREVKVTIGGCGE